MTCTVKKLARISGVSVRTLHFYDEVGLLKPAHYGANGYRYYKEEELLMLQQILFYRELGFALKEIQKVLGKGDFDKLAALVSHREILQKDLRNTKKLITTIDKTIEHLKGTKKMKDQEMYWGFSKEKQAQHEQDLIDRFGEKAKTHIAESHRKIKSWTRADWEKSGQELGEICKELTRMMEQHCPAGSAEVQGAVRRHYRWLSQFWTPNRESYAGHSDFILSSDLRKVYETQHPQLAEFLAEAMKIFAQRELS